MHWQWQCDHSRHSPKTETNFSAASASASQNEVVGFRFSVDSLSVPPSIVKVEQQRRRSSVGRSRKAPARGGRCHGRKKKVLANVNLPGHWWVVSGWNLSTGNVSCAGWCVCRISIARPAEIRWLCTGSDKRRSCVVHMWGYFFSFWLIMKAHGDFSPLLST
jgi:hypothetical protein